MRLAFEVPGPPVPKARARRGRKGAWYTPDATRKYERHVAACARVALLLSGNLHFWPRDAEYMMRVRLYFPDRRRRDADNVAKSLIDGCIKVLWTDDHRVGIECPPWEVDRERPRAEVTVEVIE